VMVVVGITEGLYDGEGWSFDQYKNVPPKAKERKKEKRKKKRGLVFHPQSNMSNPWPFAQLGMKRKAYYGGLFAYPKLIPYHSIALPGGRSKTKRRKRRKREETRIIFHPMLNASVLTMVTKRERSERKS
jgi:hypothetical protein